MESTRTGRRRRRPGFVCVDEREEVRAMAAAAFHEGFVSELVGKPAMVQRGTEREAVGKIADFVVEHPEDTFPRIDAVVVKTRYGELAAPISDVASLDLGGVVLTTPPKVVRPADD